MWLAVNIGIASAFLVRYLVTKIMLLLGLGFVTYLGIDTLVDQLETYLLNAYGQLTGVALQMAGLCGLDVSITILVSALALSMQIRVIVAGSKILTNMGR